MTVEKINEVDGLAFDDKNNELILLITDHLEWDDETTHLNILQNKINSYLSFIENEQYKEIYPDCLIENYLLKIAFEYDVSQKCIDFLSYVANQIKPLNIKIEAEVTR